MPQNWKTYKLTDIAMIVMGQSPKGETTNEVGDGLPLLNGPTEFGYSYPIPTQFTTDPRKVSEVGDLLFCVRGSTTGRMNYSNQAYAIGRGIGAFRGINGYPTRFVKYVINFYLDRMLSLCTGSTFPNLSRTDLESFPIEICDQDEAQSIARILSALDDKIELNLAMNRALEDMAMVLYKHWFVDFGPFQLLEFIDSELGRIPKGWEVKRLDELASFSNGYAFKSNDLLKQEEEDCLHVFKMGHIQKGGGLKAEGTKSWIKKSNCRGLDKYVLKEGDILMSMTDMKDNMTILGHTALMNENGKYIVNQRVGLLRVKNHISVGYPFLYILTNSVDYIDRLRSQANSGVQVNLSTDAIKSSKALVASPIINSKFHESLLPMFMQINQNAIENQTLTALRDTLLPKLISGEVRVKAAEQQLNAVL